MSDQLINKIFNLLSKTILILALFVTKAEKKTVRPARAKDIFKNHILI